MAGGGGVIGARMHFAFLPILNSPPLYPSLLFIPYPLYSLFFFIPTLTLFLSFRSAVRPSHRNAVFLLFYRFNIELVFSDMGAVF